jgi:hypothetical protein
MATKQPTLTQFKAFAKDVAPAAKAVLMARVFAQMERERVDAYIGPIFASHTFPVHADWHEGYGPIVKREKDLYLCSDESMCTAYYAECDAAHRAHGFTGPEGHCPALTAETLVMKTESALIELAEPLFGIEACNLFGDNRVKYLDLLIGACMKADKEAA